MNTHEAEQILRANVDTLSEPLKSAVEFTLTNFYASSAAVEAKKFLASLPSMTTTDAQLKAKIDAAYYALMNNANVWLNLEDLPHEQWRDVVGYEGLTKSATWDASKVLSAEKLKFSNRTSIDAKNISERHCTKMENLLPSGFIFSLRRRSFQIPKANRK